MIAATWPYNALTAEVAVRRADRQILGETSIWIPAIKPRQTLPKKRANRRRAPASNRPGAETKRATQLSRSLAVPLCNQFADFGNQIMGDVHDGFGGLDTRLVF
jgi:hypothetical protein